MLQREREREREEASKSRKAKEKHQFKTRWTEGVRLDIKRRNKMSTRMTRIESDHLRVKQVEVYRQSFAFLPGQWSRWILWESGKKQTQCKTCRCCIVGRVVVFLHYLHNIASLFTSIMLPLWHSEWFSGGRVRHTY